MSANTPGGFSAGYSSGYQTTGVTPVSTRSVALYAADKTTLLGTAAVNNTTPGSPQIIIWKNITFIAGPMIYGPASKGTSQAYYQSTYTISLPASGVTPPTPTT